MEEKIHWNFQVQAAIFAGPDYQGMCEYPSNVFPMKLVDGCTIGQCAMRNLGIAGGAISLFDYARQHLHGPRFYHGDPSSEVCCTLYTSRVEHCQIIAAVNFHKPSSRPEPPMSTISRKAPSM